MLGYVYTERQRQHFNNAAMALGKVLADPEGDVRNEHPPLGPISFIFMFILGKWDK